MPQAHTEQPPPMNELLPHPLRLAPGDDLRRRLEALAAEQGIRAAFVLAGCGSLSQLALRHAGARAALPRTGDFELLALAGTLSRDGAHLHATVADAKGKVSGGHVAHGCTVRTTAEILLAVLPGWSFRRAFDEATGHAELVIASARR